MSDAAAPPSGDPRRSFLLKALNLAIGGAIGVAMAVPILRYVFFPATRRIIRGPEGFIPVANEGQVPPGSPPVRVEIVAPEVRDAWNKISDVPFGGAWLIRDADGTPHAYSTTCPHLGCAVDFNPAAHRFQCPCHTSAFALDGSKISGPTSRGMYKLETTIEKGKILVKPLDKTKA